MPFSSPMFLFYFLPIFTILYFLLPKSVKKYFLLAGSIFFYVWGEPVYFPLIIFLIIVNYKLGIAIENKQEKDGLRIKWLLVGIILNFSVLVYFKSIINLPLGLSFITFQTVSYLVDIYKNRSTASRSLFELLLYILIFPKIISGPIVTYRELAPKLKNPDLSIDKTAEGFRRFSVGLAKKVLIADTLSSNTNRIFALSQSELTTPWAWLGLISFTIQIYFDFSGYTDMAIGLGTVLGFNMPENFNYPYISRSITEFWRRWHITLSKWFRDYVFYPLERTRKKNRIGRQSLNVLTVFLLTGLWHGLNVNFLAWGVLQGVLIVFEQSKLGKRLLGQAKKPVQHLYSLCAIVFGWVLFRTTNLIHTGYYFQALFGFGQGNGNISFYNKPVFELDFWITILLGILFSVPFGPYLLGRFQKHNLSQTHVQILSNMVILLLVFISATFILTSVSQMSLYAKF